MKKILLPVLSAALYCTILTGCGKTAKVYEASSLDDVTPAPAPRSEVRVEPDIMMPAIPGARRILAPSREGVYTAEYIHTPIGEEKSDATYELTLNADGSHTFKVNAEGVMSEHIGRWVETRSGIILFYDEEIEQPAHNVYVADSMFVETLPGGKLMLYDNCRTVILSRPVAAYYSAHARIITKHITAE